MYLRALATLGRVDCFMGKFRKRKGRVHKIAEAGCHCCPPAPGVSRCRCCSGRTIEAYRFEEKGSDVQLAVQLVKDGFKDMYDRAVVISDDSDIHPAVDIVKHELGKEIVVVSPHTGRPPSLRGTVREHLSKGLLRSSQLPLVVRDGEGREIFKPKTWP